MKFFDKLNFRRLPKLAAAVAVCGSIIVGGGLAANASPAGVAAFREAYMAQAPDTRVFDQDLTLIAPSFHLDVDSKAQVSVDGVMRMSGVLSWTYTNLQKNYSTNSQIPFYLDQVGDGELSLYVQRHGNWSKMLLPGLPAAITGIWKATDTKMLQANLDAVKDAEIIKDTADMRILRVTLDGNKIAALLEKNSKNSFANLEGYKLDEQQATFQRWLTAIKANDIVFAWTVNKPDWKTVTASFDLTEIMRAYARSVLQESAAGRVVLSPEERDLLDAVGYYSELRSYTTQIGPKGADDVARPIEAETAPENDSSLDDIFYEMTTVVKK